jgi:L-iditol 2-dehydrogenase
MKSARLTALRKLEICDIPAPELKGDGDVLIKMESAGVCGSDVHYFKTGRIGSQVVEFPFTVGHEGAGTVVRTGKAVSRVKAGDRIAVEPAMPCGKCDQCACGRHHTCRKLRFLGCPGQAEGLFSEYIVMPEDSCFKIPDSMTFEQAALSEPLAIGLYAVKKSGMGKGASIGILGAGPIGLSVLLPALHYGVGKIYVTDKIDARLAAAKKAGAYWTGNPDKADVVKDISSAEPLLLDYVFECCGQQEAADQAIKLLKPGGKLMIIGIPEFDRWSFVADDFRRKEICVQNVRRQCDCAQAALDLISGGAVNVDIMATHHFKLEKIADAFNLVGDYKDGVIKAMISL